jgi:hypothetical protein
LGQPKAGSFGSEFFTGSNDVYSLSGWGIMGLELLVTTITHIPFVVQDLILGYGLFLRNVKNLFFCHAILADYLSLV